MATYQGGQTIPGATSQSGGTMVFQGGQTIPSSTLPSIPTSGNGPTGVATSDLATNSIGAAQTNTNNLQNSVANHAVTKTANAPGFDPTTSIVDLLTSKGQPSDYASRAKLATQAGIQNYTGSAQQNAQLIGHVNSQDAAAANAPTTTTTNPTAAGGTATTTATTPSTATSSTTSTTGGPFVNTGAPGDVYNSALNDTFNQLGQTADQMTTKINSILNGTFPLTAMQQASMNSVTDALHQVTQQQIAAGKSAQGIAAINANRTGLATTDPVETANEQQQIMSDNLNKIQNLDDDASKTLGALQQSFMDSDMTGIMDNYSVLKDTLDAKTAAIEKAQDDVNSFSEFWDDYSQKQQEYTANFNAEYGGLLNPTTGLPNPGALQSLGVSSTVNGVGQVLDTGSPQFKNLPAGLQKLVTANSGGVAIDSSTPQGAAFMTAANVLGNILTLKLNAGENVGALINTNNVGVLGDLGTKLGIGKLADLQKILGPGVKNIADVESMTVGQLTTALQTQMANNAGVPVTTIQAMPYQNDPTLAASTLQQQVQSNPANAKIVAQALQINPNASDAALLQAIFAANGQSSGTANNSFHNFLNPTQQSWLNH